MSQLTTKLPLMLYTTRTPNEVNIVNTKLNLHHPPNPALPTTPRMIPVLFVCEEEALREYDP